MQQAEALVSVVVPVYNTEKYLEECIGCLRNQTYQNLEVILVNDGSTDSSGEICDRAAQEDSRFRVIHKKNCGVSDARNTGIGEAKGKYICFMDSDDLMAPFGVETMLDALLQTDAEMCVGNYRNFTDSISFSAGEPQKVDLVNGREAVGMIIGKEHVRFTIVNYKLYKRELFDNLRFLSGKIHEDEDLMYRVLYGCSRIALASKIIYGYRVRPNSIMTSAYNRSRLAIVDIAKKRAEFFEEQKDEFLQANFKWVYALLLLQNYPRVKKDLKDPVLAEKFKKEYRKLAPQLLHASALSAKRKMVIALFYLAPGFYSSAMDLKESIKNVRK